VELLRNIFDQIQRDKAYKELMDKKYRERVLQTHVRKLSVFGDLTDEQYRILRGGLELVSFEAGQVIFDEYDRSDSIYIVRSGLVKVLKKVSTLVGKESLRDRNWADLCNGLKEGSAQPATPKGKVWLLLPETTRAIVANTADPARLSEADKEEIRFGLNEVIKNPQLVEAKELQGLAGTAVFKERIGNPTGKPATWPDQVVRLANRLLLEGLFPTVIRNYRPRVGPECVLRYCTRGDILGEIGLMHRQPRSASCIAFGHPVEGSSKDSGRVELVRIPAKVFWKMLELAPEMRAKVEAQATERERRTREVMPATVAEEPKDVTFTRRFQDLGLIQGQKLMLIDLDRCTRCDECVRACVNTHEDGYSRLFLDGPRFDKYLVPTSCRACLDPVCMIGCPVGSIHRGDNGQIVIEDWCIGCGLCAKNCPYGSIQMHDIGIISGAARGWKFTSAALETEARWNQPGYNDRAWAIGETPFRYDMEFRARLGDNAKSRKGSSPVAADPVCFRYEFQLSRDLLKQDGEFTLEVKSVDPVARVWINGCEVTTDQKAKRGVREFSIPQADGAPVRNPLRAGRNIVAVEVKPNPDEATIPLLELRLDAVVKPDVPAERAAEVTQKQVTERAVVCDLCSESFGKVPACVNACPHDAAMRVDARFEFPM
jgi:Fe-S-cluster-containing hydrogenase component 2